MRRASYHASLWILTTWALTACQHPSTSWPSHAALPPGALCAQRVLQHPEALTATPDPLLSTFTRLLTQHHPDPPPPSALLAAAAHQLAHEIPWLILDTHQDTLYLCRGDTPLGALPPPTFDTLPHALSVLANLSTLSPEAARLALLTGAAHAVDPYTAILGGPTLTRFRARLTGSAISTGLSIKRVQDRFLVFALTHNSPAAHAGIAPGDEILTLDHVSLRGHTLADVLARLEGEPDTHLLVEVQRGDVRLSFDLKRTRVVFRNVEHRVLDDALGVLHVRRFSTRTPQDLDAALDLLAPLDGLILDLRANGGGDIEAAIHLADRLLASGDIIRLTERQHTRVPLRAQASPSDLDLPLVVLVGPRTASAAELLAATLQAHGRAQVMGLPTYGKGSVQKLFPLGEDLQLKLTTGEYLAGRDTAVEGVGITPDVRTDQVVLPAHDDPTLELARLSLLGLPAQDLPEPPPIEPLSARLRAEPDPHIPNRWTVQAEITHPGTRAVSNVDLELRCPTFEPWDGVIFHLEHLATGETRTLSRGVTLPPGVSPRSDQVQLVAPPDTLIATAIFEASSAPRPHIRFRVTRTSHQLLVEIHTDTTLSRVFATLAYDPRDAVRILDASPPLDTLSSSGILTFDLEAPETLSYPLELVLRGSPFGDLLRWRLALPAPGESLELEAPRIEIQPQLGSTSADLDLQITDDRSLTQILIFHNGHKRFWIPTSGSSASLSPHFDDLEPGTHTFSILAIDDHDLQSRIDFAITLPTP